MQFDMKEEEEEELAVVAVVVLLCVLGYCIERPQIAFVVAAKENGRFCPQNCQVTSFFLSVQCNDSLFQTGRLSEYRWQ